MLARSCRKKTGKEDGAIKYEGSHKEEGNGGEGRGRCENWRKGGRSTMVQKVLYNIHSGPETAKRREPIGSPVA